MNAKQLVKVRERLNQRRINRCADPAVFIPFEEYEGSGIGACKKINAENPDLIAWPSGDGIKIEFRATHKI